MKVVLSKEINRDDRKEPRKARTANLEVHNRSRSLCALWVALFHNFHLGSMVMLSC